MLAKTIFTNADGYATITCENCGHTKSVRAAEVRVVFRPLKVQCACKHEFFVCIELRKFYRKSARLSGHYAEANVWKASVTGKGNMLVENLSRRGVGFRTTAPHRLHLNEIIEVRFTLDDAYGTALRKRAAVRHLDNGLVGAEFFDFDSYSPENRTLGFYLMPR